MVGFGTGFTGRAGMGKKPLSLASMRTHIAQVKALLRGDIADIDGGLAQILASDGWLPDRPINVPVYMAGQGPKARALAKEITDGLISLGGPAEGYETCLGQHQAYLARQLEAFLSMARANEIMHQNSKDLNAQQISQVTAYRATL